MANPQEKPRYVSPNAGGCWFCCTDTPDLVFDWEWDTFVHVRCIRNVLEKDPNHPEAALMKYLLEEK